MKRLLKIGFKIFKITFGVLLILYLCVYIYVTVNKKSIIAQVTADIGKKMNGHIFIEDVELSFFKQFPKVSVQLTNVAVTDSLFKNHGHTFFKAKNLLANISIMRLIQKRSPLNGIVIEQGSVYLYTDSTGYSNTYMIGQKKDSAAKQQTGTEKNELQSIILKETSFIIDDRKKEKLHNYYIKELEVKLDEKDASVLLVASADILINSMAFNLPRGSFLKNAKFAGDFKLKFNRQSNSLQFDSINISLSGQHFNLSGRFDLQGEDPQFYLRAHTRNLQYSQGKAFTPYRIDTSLSKVDLDRPLDVDVSLDGPLKGGEPLIFINWVTTGTGLKTPFLDFNHASFTGYFTNQYVKTAPREDANSIISISHFSADWRGLPLVAGNIEILNLEKPIVTCDLVAAFPLSKLNDVTGSDDLQMQSGEGSIDLTYKGPIERNNNTNSLINGTVSFKEGSILYIPRNVVLKNLSGQIEFKNSDVFINSVRCIVLNNKVLMQGRAKNLLNIINTEPGKANIDWNINVPSLNLGAFTFLLKPDKKIIHKASSLGATASNIDEVLEKATLHVNLDAPNLIYKKFAATNLNADVSLLQNQYILNNVSMKHAGGSINMKGSLLNQKENYLKATIKTKMNNVDVSNVLNAFDNFGQDAIKGQNLAGRLTADIDATLGLNEDGAVYPSSVFSTVNFSLKDGALINFEPVKKMQNFLFKNRDFDNIRFAELKDRFDISKGDIKINRMEIQSTVFSFFVEGIYSMKGNTDVSIQVPLSNLKKRGADYKPENIGTDKKAGRSIFLRGRPGSDGNVSFKLDLFNRYKKKKQRE